MKRFMLLALAAAMCMGILTACRRSTGEQTQATQPSLTMPSEGNMLPGPEDTLDPTNGANEEITETTLPEADLPTTDPQGDLQRIRPKGRVLPSR